MVQKIINSAKAFYQYIETPFMMLTCLLAVGIVVTAGGVAISALIHSL